MNINQSINLYENWIKKPEMNFIIQKANQLTLFNENPELIYMIMIETISNNIKNNLDLLTTDSYQLEFYKKSIHKIYINLHTIYNIKEYKLYNYGLNYYFIKSKIDSYLGSLIDYEIEEDYLAIETFFRGIHQIIEINLIYLMRIQDSIEQNICINNEISMNLIYKNIKIWSELIECLNLLSSMDEYKYQKYRNLIYGTSGGESINLRKLQKRIQNLDNFIEFDIIKIIMNRDDKKYIISAIKMYQYYSTQFWLTHFNLAASTNGIKNKGTKETPIIKLIERCITMTDTKINNAIHKVSEEVKDDSYTKKVIVNDKERCIGVSIYNSSKEIFDE